MTTDITPSAQTKEQAAAFIGRPARFNPEHRDNEDDPMIQLIGAAEGQIVDSYIISGKHALAVEFLTPWFSGMIRPVAADRFLVKADA